MIDRERIIHYVLDLVSAPPGKLPERAANRWDDLLRGAHSLRIIHPVAAWILDMWPDRLRENLVEELKCELSRNIARNAAISAQVEHLSTLFGENGISCIFIKGAAGQVRSLYPPGWRFMSDIDIIIPDGVVNEAVRLMKNEGYHELPGSIVQIHHVQPLTHSDHVSSVELHTEPYPRTPHEPMVLPEIRACAEHAAFKGKTVTVPSITDHVWILARTDPVGRPLLPRLEDVIELALINSAGYDVDFDRLIERAEKERMPGLMAGMSYACSVYGGITPFAPVDRERIRRWESWSLELRRRLLHKSRWESSRQRFVAVTFLASPGFIHGISFFAWLCKLVCHTDRFVPGMTGEPCRAARYYRIMKLGITYVLAAVEYWLFRLKGFIHLERAVDKI